MNSSIIRYILGTILKTEGVLLLLSCIVSLFYQESQGLAYLAVAVLCGLCGFLLTIKKNKDHIFYLKEGCVATALSWIFLSFLARCHLY